MPVNKPQQISGINGLSGRMLKWIELLISPVKAEPVDPLSTGSELKPLS